MHFHPEYALKELKCCKCNHNDLSLLLVASPGKIKFCIGSFVCSQQLGWTECPTQKTPPQPTLRQLAPHRAQGHDFTSISVIEGEAKLWIYCS